MSENHRKSQCEKFSKGAISLDRFGQSFNFRLPDGRRDKRTWQGMVFTFVVSTAILFYAAIQLTKLISYDDTTIMLSARDSFFGTDFEFNTDDGLMLAFGLTAYDSNYESIEDDDYGTLKAYYKTWGFEGAQGEAFTEIPSTFCTLN